MKPTKQRYRLFLVPLVSLFSMSAYGAELPDWDKWRGPNGNSIVYEKGWSPDALCPEPKYVWRETVGHGYSAPCITGDYPTPNGQRLYKIALARSHDDDDTRTYESQHALT